MNIDTVFNAAVLGLASLALGCIVTSLLQKKEGLATKSTTHQQHIDPKTLLRAVSRVAPQTVESREESELALARAGIRMTPAELWSARLVCAAATMALAFALSRAAGADWIGSLLACAAGVLVGFLSPQLYLLLARRKWQDDIERQLPGALDLLCLTVMAGSTFEAGVRTVSVRTTGTLADALKQVVAASKFSSMTAALGTLADNAGVKTLTIFVASLKQAEDSGMAVADILRSQAESIRATRRLQVEEQINKLPMKMTFPIMLIFMSFMLMILAPLLASMVDTLGGIA